MKKHFVIISNFYPPFSHVASNRILAFAKYLDKKKFEVTVITEKRKGIYPIIEGVNVVEVQKTGLFNKLEFTNSKSKFNHKLRAVYNKILLSFKEDEYASWTNAVTKKISIINKEKKIDLLMASFAPISPILAALNFLDRNPNVFFIADMRDEMSESPFIVARRKEFLKSVEQKVFKTGNLILSVSKPIVDGFCKLANDRIKCLEIRNGFDFEIKQDYRHNSIFKMLYLGTFYANRKPYLFFEALNELIESGEIDINKIELEFIGPIHSYSVPNFVKPYFKQKDRIPHSDSLMEMKKADCLIVMHPNNGVKGIYTGKIFEYLGSCRPILGLLDEDDVAAKLLKEAEAGEVADFHDKEKIKSAILQLYDNWRNKRAFEPKFDIIQRQNRKDQVQFLNDHLLKHLNH
ncbi:MAG: hypothetical protein ACJ0QL_04655 [Parvicellaceae bacterium]